MRKYLSYSIILLLLIFLTINFNSNLQAQAISGELTIFHAGSLSIPFKEMEKVFEEKYPRVDVKREADGSRTTVRKVTDLERKADLVASADYTVIEELMIPEYTDWYISFATNEMVIMYTPYSKYKEEINSDNWYNILLKEDVEYGHSDPNADPCGYRSQLVWKLAENFYNKENLHNDLDKGCPPNNVRSKETDLIALLESGSLDYIFIYRSVAEQHEMPFVILPDRINLKTNKYSDYYKKAEFEVNGKKPGEKITKVGQPMVYGITIPNNSPNKEAAQQFVEFVVSKEGQKILSDNGQPPLKPVVTNKINSLPESLKSQVKGE
ncbi:MAG: tungstate ABC transporter substrate-binding protein WtpA [Halanaerobiales bacterium]